MPHNSFLYKKNQGANKVNVNVVTPRELEVLCSKSNLKKLRKNKLFCVEQLRKKLFDFDQV